MPFLVVETTKSYILQEMTLRQIIFPDECFLSVLTSFRDLTDTNVQLDRVLCALFEVRKVIGNEVNTENIRNCKYISHDNTMVLIAIFEV